MSELEFTFLTGVLTQNFNTINLVKFLEKNQKLHIYTHGSNLNSIFVIMGKLKFLLLTRVFIQNFKTSKLWTL
jgi:hypothetical protein